MMTALVLALCMPTKPGHEFVVTVTYYEAEPQAKNREARTIREFRQNLACAKRDVVYRASELSFGWVPKANNHRLREVSELVYTSVEALGSTHVGVRLAGQVQYWEDTKTKHTKMLDGEYHYGAPVIVPLSAPRSQNQVWAVVLVSKPPVARVDN